MSHDDGISNPSKNRPFHDVLAVNLDRRKVLRGGLATAVTAFFATPVVSLAAKGGLKGPNPGKAFAPLVGFSPVTLGMANAPDYDGKQPLISPDYEYQTIISWGDKLYPSAPVTPYDGDPTRRPDPFDQQYLIGIGHDGMTFFARDGKSNAEGMLCINHEFGSNFHVLGYSDPQSMADVLLSQHAHGVSVVALKAVDGKWQTADSPNARRIHVNTPVTFSGPVAGTEYIDTPAGNAPAGTVNNCSNGETPWGTYLTCEENFNGYFGARGAWTPTEGQTRYGFRTNGFGYGWHLFDDDRSRRFDLSNPDYRNEENRFGWVVEIDPNDGSQVPVKRTALGRFKHEGVAFAVGRGGRAVCYMGDDEAYDYIYKFVSERNWKAMRAQGLSPLDHGRLYVAKFNDDGTGDWMELTIDNPVLAKKFKDQAELLTYTRLAADLLGATPMDRPEWTTVAPNGDVYCTLTNNSARLDIGPIPINGRLVDSAPNASNPLAPNADGHIIRFRDDDQHTGTRFVWDIFIFARDTHGTEESFADPDGMWADPDGRLFIQTDGGQKDGLNNQLVIADADTREIRRLFTGVNSDEITGIAVTPDRRTLFINTQHPGNGDPSRTNFPAATDGVTIPRDTTFVITRKDGGIVGS